MPRGSCLIAGEAGTGTQREVKSPPQGHGAGGAERSCQNSRPRALRVATRMGRGEPGPSPRNDAGPSRSRSTGPVPVPSPVQAMGLGQGGGGWGAQSEEPEGPHPRPLPSRGHLPPLAAGEVISYVCSVGITHVRQNK